MSLGQRCFKALLPERWFAALEADSRCWMIQCRCGHEHSVWDAGGIRYKAAGKPRWYLRCPQCHERSWQRVYRKAVTPQQTPP
jgi:hypothetical protein